MFAVENAIKGDDGISHATGLCKKLLGYYSHSWRKRVTLEEAQKELNLPVYALITKCQTRW